MGNYILKFKDLDLLRIAEVGGKNASLGEMYQKLSVKDINVPDGYATTAQAYWEFLDFNHVREKLSEILSELDIKDFSNLNDVGQRARNLILSCSIPSALSAQIVQAYHDLQDKYGEELHVAVRSSATAEDLPHASFAGQHDSFLNIYGQEALLQTCLQCYASLFTDRAIKYRHHHGFDHMKVALSIGVQKMVRADLACSGVGFTIDPESGFENVVLITGSWGLGENVVQGAVNPDEFYVFKPSLKKGLKAIIGKKMGSKLKTMVYVNQKGQEGTIINIDTPESRQERFVLTNEEVEKLARWALTIEDHYKRPMDIEWAKDGVTGEMFIVQARPETIHSKVKQGLKIKEYVLKGEGEVITRGKGIGNKILTGKARVIESSKNADLLEEGEILVTDITNPDWDLILKKTSAIVTNKGGRTSHAAIVAREMGALAVVGTGNATEVIKSGDLITVSCTDSSNGLVFKGQLPYEEIETPVSEVKLPKTEVKFIIADPDKAFHLSFFPNHGVGLMRLEFVINNAIQIHPMALIHFDELNDPEVKAKIEALTHHYPDKENYFVDNLARAVATIAAAFYPKEVIVRMSDFKTNEYANLIGGKTFEPLEENPMLGFRGASRYYHKAYKEGFGLECKAMKIVRDEMGLDNVKLMIPFCRTVEEGEKVIQIMNQYGLVQGENNLQIYVMAEIPSNVILAERFAEVFDGFSIGSNDLTQLTLGIDRDSSTVSDLFNENDQAAKQLISMAIQSAKKVGKKIGLCGQAPSDFPEFASFLVNEGIDSISFNADALLKGIKNVYEAEQMHRKQNAHQEIMEETSYLK
jgi:pyruvate, water dikinase